MKQLSVGTPAAHLRTFIVIVITAFITVTITLAGTSFMTFLPFRSAVVSDSTVEPQETLVKTRGPYTSKQKNISKWDKLPEKFDSRNFAQEKDVLGNKELETTDKPKIAEDAREIEYKKENEKCKKRLPQAIIVGIQKCGTTALLKFLNNHPQIAACLDPIEPQFFSGKYDRSLAWYKNLMPCSYSNQITIEKSPPYFYRPYCAERIRKMNPRTRIIVIVKDPIVRAESMYAMVKEYGEVGNASFENLVTVNNRTKINTSSLFIDFSNYQKHAKAWIETFSLEQILLVDGHSFETDPARELKQIERFLNIGSYFTSERFVFNKTKGKYCLRTKKNGYNCLGVNKGRTHPQVSDNVLTLLQDYFRPLNKQFFEMVHRHFDWGY